MSDEEDERCCAAWTGGTDALTNTGDEVQMSGAP